MHQAHVRPVVTWKLFQPDDIAIWIVRAEKTEAVWNRDAVMRGPGFVVRNPTELQRRAGLRLVKSFHGREFGRLKFGDGAGAEIAADHLQRSAGACKRERYSQCVAMKSVPTIAQQEERMNRGHGKSGCDKGSQSHVHHLMTRGRV